MAFRFETPIIHTARLQLRPVRAEDVPRVQEEFGRWSVIKNMTKGTDKDKTKDRNKNTNKKQDNNQDRNRDNNKDNGKNMDRGQEEKYDL